MLRVILIYCLTNVGNSWNFDVSSAIWDKMKQTSTNAINIALDSTMELVETTMDSIENIDYDKIYESYKNAKQSIKSNINSIKQIGSHSFQQLIDISLTNEQINEIQQLISKIEDK